MGKFIDLTNQQFGYWNVICKTNKRNSAGVVFWHCKCKCGQEKDVLGTSLRQGKSLSCGCLKKEKASQIKNDYTNQRFGKLLVISSLKKEDNKIYWRCQCDCGNIIDIRADRLSKATSCGCYTNAKRALTMSEDLTNKRFGKLLVIEPIFNKNKHKVYWKCECDCGNIYYTSSGSLKNGTVQSCGCIKSIGERNIADILRLNNIKYEKEKIFSDFIFSDTKYPGRFDFYLIDYNRLVEFDGRQHFNYEKGWNTYERLLETQKRDKEKNIWALQNNIPLVRIPYWERDNITLDMILGDKYLVKE